MGLLLSLATIAATNVDWLLGADAGVYTNPVDATSDSPDTKVRAPRILVVDDERLVADTLSEILKRFKYDALPFYNGETAIEAARQQCPDIVLSDVIMPRLNGVETVLKIREICPRTRVILLSGNAATANLLAEAHDHGHDFELLAKPVHPDELLRHLH